MDPGVSNTEYAARAQEDRVSYDAFISYSHDRDAALAPRLRTAIQRIGRTDESSGPAIFLDESGLSASPALWSSIATALDDSRYLILLASPEAAASTWVDRELRHWLATRPAGSVLQVLTGGDLVWDPVMGDFAPEPSTALAPALAGRYEEEPHYIDMRWAASNGVQGGDPRLRSAAAQIAAPLVGRSPDTLNDEVAAATRRERTRRRVARSSLVLLAVAVALAAVFAFDISRRLDRDTLAHRTVTLAQEVDRLRHDRPDSAALAAVEAAVVQSRIADPDSRASSAAQAREALMDAVVTAPVQDLGSATGRRIVAVAMSEPQVAFGDTKGRREVLASLDAGGSVRIWDLGYGHADGVPVATLDLTPPGTEAGPEDLTLSPDGAYLAVRTGAGTTIVSLAAAASPRSVATLEGARTPVHFSSPGAGFAVDATGALWDLTCAASIEGCGVATPRWQVPDSGVVAADMRWDPPAGVDAVVWADSVTATTIARREWSLRRTPAGVEATPGTEAAIVEDRCGSAKCSLLSFAGGFVLDMQSGARNHTLSLVAATDTGLVRAPAEAKVPYTPISTLSNPRGSTASPNDPATDRFVVLADHDGNLFIQTADTHNGISSNDTRVTFHVGGDIGSVDGTGTFLVGGDRDGRLHLFALAPGQPFVSAGLPDEAPSMPLEGTDLVLRTHGKPAAECCDLDVIDVRDGKAMTLGTAPASQVRAVTCDGRRYITWPRSDPGRTGSDLVSVVRFPDTATAVVPLLPDPGDRPAGAPSITCGPDGASVVVAVAGLGMRRVGFGVNGPTSVAETGPGDCCPNPAGSVVLSSDGGVLISSRSRGQSMDQQGNSADLAVYAVGSGARLDTPEVLSGTRAPVVVAMPAPGRFLVGRGTSLSVVDVDTGTGTVNARRVAEAEAPVAALAVAPAGTEAVVGTASTTEIVSLVDGRRIGEPLRFAGVPRYGGDGVLWIHPATYRNPLLFARVDLSMQSLADSACALVGRSPTGADWDDVAEHHVDPVCRLDADGTWRAAI